MGYTPRMERVVVADYDPRWPALFREERERLVRALDGGAVDVQHIGSTAVPALAAKPIVDILVGVRRLPIRTPDIGALCRLGYEYRGEHGIPGRLYFKRPGMHVHLVAFRSPFWDDHVAFRDALRGSRELALEYSVLKRRLAQEFGDDRARYQDGKTAFIRRVTEQAAARV